MKKLVFVMCSLVIAVALVVPSFFIIGNAENDYEKTYERFTYIQNYRGSISKGLISTSVYAEISGKENVTSVKIKMELQKESSGSYSTIETWEQTFSGRNGSISESKLTNPLSTYRLKATVTAYSGSNSESKTFYEY